jgi:hypothetical protein
MAPNTLRLRSYNPQYAVISVGFVIVPLGGFTALAAVTGHPVFAIVLGASVVLAAIFFYSLWFRGLDASDTALRMPSGFFGRQAVPIDAVCDVGLLYRHVGADAAPGWVLEVTDVSGARLECPGIFFEGRVSIAGRSQDIRSRGLHRPKPHPIEQTRPGRAATALYQWVATRQGPEGPLTGRDCQAHRQWVTTGPGEHLAWWSPDGRLICVSPAAGLA